MSRLDDLIASALSVEVGSFGDDDGPETIESWDSLNHVMLAGLLEEAFAVTLSADELMSARSVGDFRRLLRAKGCDA